MNLTLVAIINYHQNKHGKKWRDNIKEKERCEVFLNKDSVYPFLGNASKVYEIACTNLMSSKNLMARR